MISRLFEDLQGLKGRLETSEMPIWRSYEFLSVTSRFVSKNYPRHSEIQLSMTIGEGAKMSTTILGFQFWPKVPFACLAEPNI